MMFSEKTELKPVFQERVKQRSPVKESWMVTAGVALKWGYTGMQMGKTINIVKHHLAASVSLASNQDDVT